MIRNIYFNKGLHKNKKKLYAPQIRPFCFQLSVKLLIESILSQIKEKKQKKQKKKKVAFSE